MELYILDGQAETILAIMQDNLAEQFFNAVHDEQLNRQITFSFEMPADHPNAQYCIEGNIVGFNDYDNNFQAFEMTYIEERHAEELIKIIQCEHVVYELMDDFIEDTRLTAASPTTALTSALTGTRWSVGTVEIAGSANINYYRTNPFAALQDIANTYGGEFRFRLQITGNSITGRFVDLLTRRGSNTGVRIERGRNMMEIVRQIDFTNVKTALFGFGKGEQVGDGFTNRIDFGQVVWTTPTNPANKPLNQKYVEDTAATAQWGRVNGTRKRYGVFYSDNQTDPDALLQETWDALQRVKDPYITYACKLVDLEKFTGLASDKVRLGDTVNVLDFEFNPPLLVQARIVQLKRVLDMPEESEVVLGNYTQQIVDQGIVINDLQNQASNSSGIIEDAILNGDNFNWLDGLIEELQSESITRGGYVYMSTHDGIDIYDAPIDEATSVLRLKGGIFAIANSKIMGEWDFRTFGTGDGFTADLINVGTMLADRIEGGTLALGGQDIGGGQFSNGIFVVYNSDGDVIAQLDGNYGGFGTLGIDFLTGTQNVIFKTTNRHENYVPELDRLEIYVDPYNGDDNNIGTSDSPMQRINSALQKIPKYLEHDVYIFVFPSMVDEDIITISGFMGQNQLFIQPWRIPIRYVRSWLNGSDLDNSNQWVEVQAVRSTGTNVALSASRSSSDPTTNIANLPRINDGVTTSSLSTIYQPADGVQWVQLDLGSTFTDIDYIRIYNYAAGSPPRIYNGYKVQVSEDGTNWYDLYDDTKSPKALNNTSGFTMWQRFINMDGDFFILGCTARIIISYFMSRGSDQTSNYLIQRSNVRAENGAGFTTATDKNIFFASQHSYLEVENFELNAADSFACTTANGSTAIFTNTRGSSKFGYAAAVVGTQALVGTTLTDTGGTLHNTLTGGETRTANIGAETAGRYPQQIGGGSSPATTTVTKQFTAVEGRTWYSTGWRSDSEIVQGQYTGLPNQVGYFFFGSTMRDTVVGKTIRSVKIFCQRTNTAGNVNDTKIYPQAHGAATRPPSTKPTITNFSNAGVLDRNESTWFDVTANFASGFNAGTTYGIAFGTSSTNLDSYCKLINKCIVEITYDT